MYYSHRCLIELENIVIPLTYVLFSEFLDSAIGYHRLYLVQRVEVRCCVCSLAILPLHLCPRQHVAMISQPSLCHHADVLRHLLVGDPSLLIDLHRLRDRTFHRRNYLCLQLPVHTYAKRVIVRLRAIVPSMGSPMMALNCQP